MPNFRDKKHTLIRVNIARNYGGGSCAHKNNIGMYGM